jgi:hypothetical protein
MKGSHGYQVFLYVDIHHYKNEVEIKVKFKSDLDYSTIKTPAVFKRTL